MARWRLGLGGLALLAVGCGSEPAEGAGAGGSSGAGGAAGHAGAAGGAGTGGVDPYAADERWLCRPGIADNHCTTNLDSTVVHADGTIEVEPHVVATDPPFDCFYIYPTVNLGTEGNAPFDGEYDAEARTATQQAGRLSAVCAVHAPLYRQVTLGAFSAENVAELREIAWGDVLAAWEHYRSRRGDRAVVLIGHSQGAGLVNRLVRERIDDDPAERARLISAFVIGSSVAVPPGADVGGDFDNVPACRSAGDQACVVSWASFRETEPPPPDSRFGLARPGFDALCNNPAALAGGRVELHGYYPLNNPRAWQTGASGTTINTPFIQLPGLVFGECVNAGGFSYLQISLEGDPATPRTDDISGDLTPVWGLHLADVWLTMGDVVELVRAQGAAR